MKIAYIANIRLPTEKAHGLQIMKTCEAFVKAGHEVELIVTDRKTPIAEDPSSYYSLKTKFAITRVHVWDTVEWGPLGFWLETFSFARACLRHLKGKSYDVIYSRDEVVLAHIGERTTTPIVWETHTGAEDKCTRFLTKKGLLTVAITQGLKDFYIGHGASAEKIVVAPDGIDLADFENPQSASEARTRLGLPQDKKIALYIGRLDGWKGSGTFLVTAALLPDWAFAVVGGEEAQVASLKAKYPDVRFLGQRPYRELRDNQAAADVLVLPNTGRDVISQKFTSPLKLFTYMASGKPIVASDLPSIREVLDEESAYFVKSDDAQALAAGIRCAASDQSAAEKAARARELAQRYTWDKRAETILRAMQSRLSVAR